MIEWSKSCHIYHPIVQSKQNLLGVTKCGDKGFCWHNFKNLCHSTVCLQMDCVNKVINKIFNLWRALMLKLSCHQILTDIFVSTDVLTLSQWALNVHIQPINGFIL
jgi:hypothetical protein